MKYYQLTGAPDLVRKMESSVLEKIKAGPAFAVANLALTKAGNVSSRPNCMMTRECMVWIGNNQVEVQLSRETEESMSSSRSETDSAKTSQDNSSSISITQRLKHHGHQ
jgi:hypothetical protein